MAIHVPQKHFHTQMRNLRPGDSVYAPHGMGWRRVLGIDAYGQVVRVTVNGHTEPETFTLLASATVQAMR